MKLSEMPRKENNSQKKNITEAYEEMKNCSADELRARLIKEIQGQKSKGVFDYDALVSSIEKIKDYLSKETYENMLRIVESLK